MKLAKIWRCTKCNARHKAIGGLIEAPKKCECGGNKFIASKSKQDKGR